jgi:hypothetical protein
MKCFFRDKEEKRIMITVNFTDDVTFNGSWFIEKALLFIQSLALKR